MDEDEISLLASYLRSLRGKANRQQAFQWYTGHLPDEMKQAIEQKLKEIWPHVPTASRETYRRVSELATKYRYGRRVASARHVAANG